MAKFETSTSKKVNRTGFIARIMCVLICLVCSMVCFSGCVSDYAITNSETATYDARGNLRLLAPHLTYNYTVDDGTGNNIFGEGQYGINSGSISWNLSYYAETINSNKVVTPEADEQYVGASFYTADPTSTIANPNATQEQIDKFVQDYSYKGDISSVNFTSGYWSGENPSGTGRVALYRVVSERINLPNYQVVVDGIPYVFVINIIEGQSLIVGDKLNINALYITYAADKGQPSKALSHDYIKIVAGESSLGNEAEANLPCGKYYVVFNPILKGNLVNRSVKVKALPQESDICQKPGIKQISHFRGDSMFSSVVTFRANKLSFSAHSSNSADNLKDIGYLTYSDKLYGNAGAQPNEYYYFEKYKTTTTPNPADAKITYLEGYFPEGRVVKVSRERVNAGASDYALASWTTNTPATYTPVLAGTMPASIPSFFNYSNDENNFAISQNGQAGAFVVKTVYSNETHTLNYVNRATAISTLNKDNLFYENLSIEKPSNAGEPVANVGSTISVVANRTNSGYTYYANFTKVKNFTQSGTVFAGDEFFDGNSAHYLNGFTISIYEIGRQVEEADGPVVGYAKASTDTYLLKDLNNIGSKKSAGDTAPINTSIDGRAVTITVIISGSEFKVTGLEHNMCVVFDKVVSESGTIKSKYSFHNATMSNILLGEEPTRTLFVAQCDKTLCGIIGTEFEESSNIEVEIKQVSDDNTSVGDLSDQVSYEIIKSVTTKEDLFGYVTSHILLSVIVPQDHLLVRYNVETPLNSTQIYYKKCTCGNPANECTCEKSDNEYVYFNASTNTYYSVTKVNTAPINVTADGTANYLIYMNGEGEHLNQVYAYGFRDAKYNESTKKVTYNNYYYGNYKYDTTDGTTVLSFECLVASTTDGVTTYALYSHTPLNAYASTKPIDPSLCTDSETRINLITRVTSVEEAEGYLENAGGYLFGDGTSSGILFNNNNTRYDGAFDTVYHFTVTKTSGAITVTSIETHHIDTATNSDISTDAIGYKSLLKNGTGANEQDVYFYYDVVSKNIINALGQHDKEYYYTSPIGRVLNDGEEVQWFYEFNQPTDLATSNCIVLGEKILANTTNPNYSSFYSMMGQKIVRNYYYYILPVEAQAIQVRQYNDIEYAENVGALKLTYQGKQGEEQPDGTEINYQLGSSHGTYKVGDLYALPFEIELDQNIQSVYKLVELEGVQYRISFDASNFLFKIFKSDGSGGWTDENIENISLSFRFTRDSDPDSHNYLYAKNGSEFVEIKSAGGDTLDFDVAAFSKLNGEALGGNYDFKKSGTYSLEATGTDCIFTVSYSGYKINDSENASLMELSYNGTNWIDTKTNSTINISEYAVFPSFKFRSGVDESALYIKITNSATNTSKAISTDGSDIAVTYKFKDDGGQIHILKGTNQSGYVLPIVREAFTLNKDNNEKTQITVWGKYIPTSDPTDPIIYPSFSTYLERTYGYIFDPSIDGLYYDIDYSSEKALKEGFVGINWLSGSPYPNPVMYFSVRHKINELAKINLVLDIKPVFYAELVATNIENTESNLVFDFTTYSFKDTLVNIDANDYINNIYYALNIKDLSPIYGYKIKNGALAKAYFENATENEVATRGDILKVNEIYVNDNGYVYWMDSFDANGNYLDKVYVLTDESDTSPERVDIKIIIAGHEQTLFFRPLLDSDCYAWKTSKKYIKDVGYFDIHGYEYNKLNGKVVFNSGELPLNEVCLGVAGLSFGNINNDSDYYDYDQVIVSGVTSAYRTSYAQIKNIKNKNVDGLIGYSQSTAFAVLDSFNTNETYFLKGKECAMFVTNPIINTDADVYYRFLEWRIYSRYNSGIMYYDRFETDALGESKYSWSMAFTPKHSGHYVIMPVYQRMFNVAVATEVENGPYNQGGSVVTYYKDGQSTNLDNTRKQDIFSIEYLKTVLGGKADYYYNNFEFTPYVYFDDDASKVLDVNNKLIPSDKYTQIIRIPFADKFIGIKKDGTVDQLSLGAPLAESEQFYTAEALAGKLFKLTLDNNKYYLLGAQNKEVSADDVIFDYTCNVSDQTVKYNPVLQAFDIPLYRQDNLLYLYDLERINGTETVYAGNITDLVDTSAPVAELSKTKVNVVQTLTGVASAEYAEFYYNAEDNLVAGQLSYNEDGTLATSRVFKDTFIDRESEVMLSAVPDEGYRLLDWYSYDPETNKLTLLKDLYGGKDKLVFSKNDLITRAYLHSGKYYYERTKNTTTNTYEYKDTDLVPESLLYKVRGLYINTATTERPNYVEVFYSVARDKYYYDSAYAFEVEKELLTFKKDYITRVEEGEAKNIQVFLHDGSYYTSNSIFDETTLVTPQEILLNRVGEKVSNVREMTHVSAITVMGNASNPIYFLNNLQVYRTQDENGEVNFYRAYSQGNVKFDGNNIIIKSLHSNITFVAVFRETYQSMIITDAEEEFGVTIEGLYYFNNNNNDLANRVDIEGNVIPVKKFDEIDEDFRNNKDGSGFDYEVSSIDFNLFKLFDIKDDVEYANNAVKNSTIINYPSTMIEETATEDFEGYVSTDHSWVRYVCSHGGMYAPGKNNYGKCATREEEKGTFSLKNISFDVNTTALIVVRTLSSTPLQFHTLGLPSEYNFEPIFYPSNSYIQENANKNAFGISKPGDKVEDIRADYLYYIFKITYDRNPENEYFDLIVHPTREISTSTDIITGNYSSSFDGENYNPVYSKYFDVELRYNGPKRDSDQPLSSGIYFNFADYFDFDEYLAKTNKFAFTFKNGAGFAKNVILPLLLNSTAPANEHDLLNIKPEAALTPGVSLQSIYNEIAGLTSGTAEVGVTYERFVDFLFMLNKAICKNSSQYFSIGNVKLNDNYIKMFTDAIDEFNLSGNTDTSETVQLHLDTLCTLEKLIETTDGVNYVTLPITTYTEGLLDEHYYIDRLFGCLELLRKPNQKPENYESLPNDDESKIAYLNEPFVPIFDFEPVGDGSTNYICFTAITMYNFSIQSLTIDGYDNQGKVIYASKENSHKLGSDELDNNNDGIPDFVFYTSVGTNNRTYLGTVPEVEGFEGTYYNGGLTNDPIGPVFNKKYIDTEPNYQTDIVGMPSYVYKDFLLAKDSLILIEGLSQAQENEGYEFMGWYQQKRINSIYDRFYDLEGNKLNVVQTNSASGKYNLLKDTETGILILGEWKDIVDGDGRTNRRLVAVAEPKLDRDSMTSYLYYYNKDLDILYRQDGQVISKEDYQYVEWGDMELVSTSYKYPYIAWANADTIITALFKKIIKFTYSFNPFEMTVTSSTSIDSDLDEGLDAPFTSINSPLVYSAYKYKTSSTGETVRECFVTNNINKEETYEQVRAEYQADKQSNTANDYIFEYEIVVSGDYYIDATPTLTIAPVGGKRLDGVYGVKNFGTNNTRTQFDDILSFNGKNVMVLRFSNKNSLLDSTIVLADKDGRIESTYDNTNLAGITYMTVSLNNLKLTNNSAIDTEDLFITLKAKDVTLLYTRIDGYLDYDKDSKQTLVKPYDFIISTGEHRINGGRIEFVEDANIYFNSEALSVSPLHAGDDDFKFTDLLPEIFETKFNKSKIYEGLSEEKRKEKMAGKVAELKKEWSRTSGYIDEWIYNIMFLKLRLDDIEKEKYSDETLKKIAKELTEGFMNNAIRGEDNTLFKKTSANTYYYIEFVDHNLEFYGYFDRDFTDTAPLEITTVINESATGTKSIDHWYVNAQTPSSISNSEVGDLLNENVTFPTTQEIYFFKPTDTADEEVNIANDLYNKKFVLSKDNTVYMLNAVIEDQEKRTIAITLQNSIDQDANTLDDLGLTDDDTSPFDNNIYFTYTGLKFANDETLVNIDTVAVNGNNTHLSTNGSYSTKLHTGKYSTNTNFALSISDKFLVITKDIGDFASIGDVYVFVGWVIDDEIVSTDFNFNYTGTSDIEARYVKIVKVSFVNAEDSALQIKTENIEIEETQKLTKNAKVESTVFDYYADGATYYAVVGADIKFTVYTEDGYVLESASCTNPEQATNPHAPEDVFLTIKEIPTLYSTKYSFNTAFSVNSQIKLNVQIGCKLTINQLVFNDFNQTTKGAPYYKSVLYDIYKMDNNGTYNAITSKLSSSHTVAKGSLIKLKYANPSNVNPYTFIGWYSNNTLLKDETTLKPLEEIEMEITENTVIELRLAKIIYLTVNATNRLNGGTNLAFNLTINSLSSNMLPFDGMTTLSNKPIRAGEKLKITISQNTGRYTFAGWYLVNGANNQLISTKQTALELTINGDNEFITASHELKLTALYILTNTITITKQYENQINDSENGNFDVIVSYTGANGENIKTSLGQQSSITINAKYDTTVKVESVIEKDMAETRFFEGYWLNGNLTSFANELEFRANSSSATPTTVVANFVGGCVVTVNRRLNDDPYVGDAFSVACTYDFAPEYLRDDKILEGDNQFVQLAFRTGSSSSVFVATYKIKDTEHYKFIGWYCNNQRIVENADYHLSGENNSTLSITNPITNLYIEARVAELADITLSREILVGSNDTALSETKITATYNTLSSSSKVSIANIVLDATSHADDVKAYKYTTMALTASRYAGLRFVGFKVNGSFILKTDGKRDTSDIVYYHLDNSHPHPTDDDITFKYEIVACYQQEYTVNVVKTVLGSTDTNAITLVGISDNTVIDDGGFTTLTLSYPSSNLDFVGWYSVKGTQVSFITSQPGTTNTDEIVFSRANRDLVGDASNGQIILEARFARRVNITIETRNANGGFVSSTPESFPYGVTTTISSGGGAWVLPNPEDSNRNFAIYSTDNNLTILPLEDKTYYVLTSGDGNFSNELNISCVTTSNPNGLISNGSTYTTLSKNYINTVEKSGSAGKGIASASVDFDRALADNYMFVCWVGGARYKVDGGLQYFPISNELEITEATCPYNEVFAVFVNAKTQIIRGNTGTHLNSFATNLSISENYGPLKPFVTKYNPETNATTIYYPYSNSNFSGSANAVNGYNISGGSDLSQTTTTTTTTTITTTRTVKTIGLPQYIFNTETRIAVRPVENITITTNSSNTNSDQVIPGSEIVTYNSTITIDLASTDLGHIEVYKQDGSLVQIGYPDVSALDNIFIKSFSEDNCYLSHYIITRRMDNNDRICEIFTDNEIANKYLSLKVLDGSINIRPVFRKTFDIVVDTSSNVTNHGNYASTDISSGTATQATKRFEIVAEDNYRIAGISVDGHQMTFDYNQTLTNADLSSNLALVTGSNTASVSVEMSDADASGRSYIKKLTFDISRSVDVFFTIAYLQVKTITLVDGATNTNTLLNGSNELPSYELYFDDSTLAFDSGDFVATNKNLTKEELIAVKEHDPLNTTLVNIGKTTATRKFLGYYYNNEVLPTPAGINISSDTKYTIVAVYVVLKTVEISIALYDENNSVWLNENTNEYKSVYNTPYYEPLKNSGFYIEKTTLITETGSHTETETTALIGLSANSIYQKEELTFYSNENLALNAYGNEYFAFDGWYTLNTHNNEWVKFTLDNNSAFNPNNEYINHEKYQARWIEKVRTITINPNYEIGVAELGDALLINDNSTLNEIYNANDNHNYELSSGRNIVVDKVEDDDVENWIIKYSVASSILEDVFTIKETNFNDNGLDYYVFETTDEKGNATKYKFKNFTQEHNKVLRNYTVDVNGKYPPSATIYLEDFYNNQNLNINTVQLVNIQYTLATTSVSSHQIKLTAPGVAPGDTITITPTSISDTYDNLIIDVWVEAGSVVSISADPQLLNTICYSTIKPIKITRGEEPSSYDTFSDFYDNPTLSDTALSSIMISDLGLDEWVEFVVIDRVDAYSNLTDLFIHSGTQRIDSISQYSFIASENIYFIADYIPIFSYCRRFVNAFIAPTDKTNQLSKSSNLYTGDTFGIVPKMPSATATFNYRSVSAVILDVIDRHNNIISLDADDKTTFKYDELKETDLAENDAYNTKYLIETTMLTESLLNHSATIDESIFGENAVKGIIEQLANLSVVVGVSTGTDNFLTKNAEGNTSPNPTKFNHYETLLEKLVKSLNGNLDKDKDVYSQLNTMLENKLDYDALRAEAEAIYENNIDVYKLNGARNQAINGIIENLKTTLANNMKALNDVKVKVEKYDQINDNYTTLEHFKYELNKDDVWSFDSLVNDYLQVGSTVNISATVKNEFLNNWYFKGFMLVNSASVNKINPFVNGEALKTASNYSSYKVIPYEELTATADGTTYSINNVKLSGDTQIVVLYEKKLIKLEVRLKDTSEEVNSQYVDMLKAGVNLAGRTIYGINLNTDPNSSKGYIASNTSVYVRENEPAVVTIINRPFGNLVGWAVNNHANNFVSEPGKPKTVEELPLLFNDLAGTQYTTFPNPNTLVLVDTTNSWNNLYVKNVTSNLIIGAYFEPMSYVISMVIKEAELALDSSRDGNNMSGYVSIVETEGEGESATTSTSYIETVFDENGKLLNTQMKVKLSLIDIKTSLLPETTTHAVNLSSIDAEQGKMYLKYTTGDYVIRHYENKDGDIVDEIVEIIPNKVSTQYIDQETATEGEPAEADREIVKLTTANIYTDSNLTLYNYSDPTNTSIYFRSDKNTGKTVTRIRPGLIQLSFNNKRPIDLASYNIIAASLDADGNIIEDDENAKNFKINFIVTAKANVGFPSIKIITNNPVDQPSIISYAFDDSDYIAKLKMLTSKQNSGSKEDADAEIATEKKVQNFNTNKDLNMISGFYNTMFENTASFTDSEFKYDNCSFTLKLVYARKVLPLVAKIQTSSGDEYEITKRYGIDRNYNLAKQTLMDNVIRYDYYTVENGAYIANQISNYMTILNKSTDGDRMQTASEMLLLLSKFPKINEFRINGNDTYNLLSKLSIANAHGLSHLTNDNITKLFGAMSDNGFIAENFDPFDNFKVSKIDVYQWFTGRKVTKSREQAVYDIIDSLSLWDRITEDSAVVEEFVGGTNETIGLYYDYEDNKFEFGDSTDYIVYNANSSERFSPFFVKSGDSVVTDIELSLKFKPQEKTSKTTSKKAQLYYNEASLGFESTESLGRLIFTYSNNPDIVSEQLQIGTTPDTWQKICNRMSAIFNISDHYQGTFVNQLVSSAHLSGEEINSLNSIVNVLNVNEKLKIAAFDCPFWIGEVPTSNQIISYVTGIVTAAAFVALTILTIPAGGGGGIALVAGMVIGAKIAYVVIGIAVAVAIGDAISSLVGQVDWAHLPKV